MSLPKQQLPTYTTTIPSTGKKIKFRGFTVREEKILLLAKEEEDPDAIINAIKQILTGCILDPVDVDGMTMFDIEYLITHIRAKSVGEVIELSMPCDVDPSHSKTLVGVNIGQAKVQFPEGHATTIHLYDDVHIKMKYPTLKEISSLEKASGIDAIILCIDSIYTNEEVFDAREQTKEELAEFIESLTNKQLQQIQDKFVDKMPTFEHEFTYKCKTCGHEHVKIIKGMSNFFG